MKRALCLILGLFCALNAKGFKEDEIRACFDYSYYTKNVGAIFKRVFG
ncbi:hypothetical protein ACLF8T_06785 [Helicobacter pylori]